ncbi:MULTISPECIES: AAA-like domain-containing protein [unclassified Rhizobium]|uniref:AAA-like domain-containing protein n=1 Tax=unclassified Rhizobium TaxID=2613769 RepID=UPI002B25D5E4|nr:MULTISPECIES: AAA-like domain-containing protein [unclassified Rhizobium]
MIHSPKMLSARTIIPDNLYVDRDADRQLSNVIDEMGRPGYVLVARQMGKTNLLLRMKRQREVLGELAVYVDLSIGFGDARGLFRHLIDRLLEASELTTLQSQIETDRIDSSLDPSLEYDRHLRRILSAVQKNRVIIILDEIDSLVGQPYSDRILSQVRSMYFARANFPIYEHLTYVLSGVAEPTDLIKDKNISPFNIGEKIYLNDFSRTEAGSLLEKAGIQLPDDVINMVFDWTSGNPRMTWDIFAALEDELPKGNLNPDSVNAIVQKLYLTRYDRAPLDHIRALAENDADVRAALVALLYGKGDTLDDRSRSKLYLAGITTAAANEAPRIKNRVIESALSETWLAQVEAGQKGLLTAASRRYDSGEHSEAVSLVHQYLSSGGSIENLNEVEMFEYGMALYHTGDYLDSIAILRDASIQSRSNEVRTVIAYHIGLSAMLVGNIDSALEAFEPLSKTDGPYRLRALHALGNAYLKTSIKDRAEDIISINRRVLFEADEDPNLKENEKAELVYAAHYNLGQVYVAQGNREAARKAFADANRSASPSMKPAFASARLSVANVDEERAAILEEVAEIIIRDQTPYSRSKGTLGFDQDDMAELLAVALDIGNDGIFRSLLTSAVSRTGTNAFETLVTLATETDFKTNLGHTHTLLRQALTDQTIVCEALLKQKLNAATIWLANSIEGKRADAFKAYWSIVTEPAAAEFLSANDTVVLANHVGELVQSGDLLLAKKITAFVRKNEDILAAASATTFAFFVYHEMLVHKLEANDERARRAAREILKLVSAHEISADIFARRQPQLIENLRRAASDQIEIKVRTPSKFRRNEVVEVVDTRTGLRYKAKYKKVSEGLEAGYLELLSGSSHTSPFQRR